jgi:hypothetical protein
MHVLTATASQTGVQWFLRALRHHKIYESCTVGNTVLIARDAQSQSINLLPPTRHAQVVQTTLTHYKYHQMPTYSDRHMQTHTHKYKQPPTRRTRVVGTTLIDPKGVLNVLTTDLPALVGTCRHTQALIHTFTHSHPPGMRRWWVPRFCISSVLRGRGGCRDCCLPRTDTTRARIGSSKHACEEYKTMCVSKLCPSRALCSSIWHAGIAI